MTLASEGVHLLSKHENGVKADARNGMKGKVGDKEQWGGIFGVKKHRAQRIA